MYEAPAKPFAALAAAVDEVLRAPVPADPGEATREMIECRRIINRLEVGFARRTAVVAASGQWDEWGYLSPVQFVRHSCLMTGHAAAGALRVGQHLSKLTRSVEALDAGEIGFAHLSLMGFTAQAVEEAVGEFDETPLLKKAKRHLPNRFRTDCAHVRHAADQHAFLREQEKAVEARVLKLATLADGGLHLDGYVDAEGGAIIRTALEPLAKRNGVGDERLRDRRLADALIELCEHRLDAGELPVSGGQRPHVQVTCSLETARGMPGSPAGELEWGGTVGATTVQRYSCDSNLTRIVLDGASEVLDVGRTRRTATPAQRRALRVRDGGCVWPGCDRPASWTVPHHKEQWSRDHGPTNIRNLLSICHRHHRMLHEGSWELIRSDDGRVIAVPPIADVPDRARPPDSIPAA